MAAVRAVFDTSELFEAILVRLDTKTLLLSQRVERRWRDVIASSKALQKKLFLLPTTTFDDILDFGFLDTENAEKYNVLDATSNRCKWLQQVVILNDLLFDTTREWKLRDVAFANPRIRDDAVTPSWRRMLLTQPPPSTGKGDVMFWFEDAHDDDELCEGMDTMGAMMDKVYSKEASVESFNVHWDSAAVRPVKHAVDGTYYARLLQQRRREQEALESTDATTGNEEVFEVTVFDAKGEIEHDPYFDGPVASSSRMPQDKYWSMSWDQNELPIDEDEERSAGGENASVDLSSDDLGEADVDGAQNLTPATPASLLRVTPHGRFYGRPMNL